MGERWTDHEIQRGFTDWADLCAAHNADCDAYEKRIAALEAQCIAFHAEAARHYQALARVKAEAEAATDMAIHYRDSAMAGDVVIGRLLAMLLPGVAPPHTKHCGCVECRKHEINEERYARAYEIAGRTE